MAEDKPRDPAFGHIVEVLVEFRREAARAITRYEVLERNLNAVKKRNAKRK